MRKMGGGGVTLTRGEESDALMALRLWGKNAQIVVCIEELAELIQALAKEMRVSRREYPARHAVDVLHIAEEMADVEIIMNQLRCIFDQEVGAGQFHEAIRCLKEAKLARLRERLDAAEVKRAMQTRGQQTAEHILDNADGYL